MSPRIFFYCYLLAICAGCASVEVQDEEAEPAAAVQAQMSVKAALLEDDRVSAAPVRVEYRKNSVSLSGYVETEAERRRAGEVAREAVPDLEVINDLSVWQAPE